MTSRFVDCRGVHKVRAPHRRATFANQDTHLRAIAMDVRCEKCGTEYELDEARLKPGGVTVKCTTCGHMFKIRKRAPTNVGMPPVPPIASERSQRAQTASSGVPRPRTETGGSGPSGDRNWI